MLFFFAPGAAHAAPGIPLLVYGTAFGAGTEVSAQVHGVVVAKTKTDIHGNYGYAPSVFMIPDPDGSQKGELVSFSVAGILAPQTLTFENGAVIRLDFPSATTTLVSTITTLVSETPSLVTPLLPTERTYAIRDFNMLMLSWGTRGKGSMGDFNNDGIVDLSDFNLLMIHWKL